MVVKVSVVSQSLVNLNFDNIPKVGIEIVFIEKEETRRSKHY